MCEYICASPLSVLQPLSPAPPLFFLYPAGLWQEDPPL